MTTLTFTYNTTSKMYEATYTGDSGAFQVRMSGNGGRLAAYGDAGLGYDLLNVIVEGGTQALTYLDMTGLNTVKFCSTIPVTSAIVNS